MPQGLSGLSDATFRSLILDAGAVYYNIDIEALEAIVSPTPDQFEELVANAIATAIPIGATNGGASFTRGLKLRQVEADGQLGPTKGLLRREEVRPAITVTLIEQTGENLARQLPGAVREQAGSWERLTGGPITDSTYIDNVALVTTYGEQGYYIVMVVYNALAMESPDFDTEDKSETATEVTFVGCFAGVGREEPWSIHFPPALLESSS